MPIAAAELRLLFQEQNVADYIEITQRAELALGSHDRPTDLALAMDYKLSHLLMDEVQDTSLAQIELIRKLSMGWENGDGRTLFFVGDPMQSIYRFREADVANFLKIQHQGIGNIKPESLVLQSNFRSSEQIVEWVNAVFPNVFPAEDDIVSGGIRYSPSTAAKNSAPGSTVKIYPQVEGDELTEAALISGHINDALTENPDASIGILGRSRNHLHTIAKQLRNNGIAFQAIELESLENRQPIQDLISLTRAILQLNDRIAWLAVLRAPWCGLDLHDLSIIAADNDGQTILERCMDKNVIANLSTPAGERVNRIVESIQPSISQRGRVSLRKIVEAAWINIGGSACIHHADLQDCTSYIELLDDIERDNVLITPSILYKAINNLWSKANEKANVQLLTIHKSKGLEFDIVILPQLHRRNRNQDTELLRWTRLPDQLLIAGLAHSDDKDDRFNLYLRYLERNQQEHENRRLLYVACTRARESLHLHIDISITEDGEVKPPVNGSLGAILWPALETDIMDSFIDNSVMGCVQQVEQPETLPLTKFRRLPVDWSLPELPDAISPPIPDQIIDQTTRQDPRNEIEFSWAGESLRISGIAIHQMLQNIDIDGWHTWQSLNPQDILEECNPVLIENGLDHTQLQFARDNINAAIENTKTDPRAEWIFSKEHKQIKTEWALTSWINNKFTNVVVDRTFIDETGTRWIIDFKSSRHQDVDVTRFLHNEKLRYQEQMAHYAKVMENFGQEKIMLALYFPLLKGWYEWPA